MNAIRTKIFSFQFIIMVVLLTSCGPEKVCGPNCPKGTYKSAKICDGSCTGDCSQGKTNASVCSYIPQTKKTFPSCDNECPKGYEVYDFICDENCGPCEGKTNALQCEESKNPTPTTPGPSKPYETGGCLNTGPASCPSGYHLIGKFCDPSPGGKCGPCSPGNPPVPNYYTCQLNTGLWYVACYTYTAADVCAPGYTRQEELCGNDCGPGDCSRLPSSYRNSYKCIVK